MHLDFARGAGSLEGNWKYECLVVATIEEKFDRVQPLLMDDRHMVMSIVDDLEQQNKGFFINWIEALQYQWKKYVDRLYRPWCI